jgi:transcriptional regulator with XRE-family HTH domain
MGVGAAEIIRRFRTDIGLSQVQLALVLKTSQGIISDIENGGSVSKKLAKKFSILTEQPLEVFIN